MREIKFRAWDEAGRPIKSYYNHNKYISIDTAKIINVEHDDVVDEGVVYVEDELVLLEQYTGLKDKNGVEIYEGDLLLVDNRRTVKVVYNNIIASFDTEYVDDTSPDYFKKLTNAEWKRRTKVIGNIHENPELLK